ncbi:hypothetical protein BDP55DRAFT_719243 [Colletotrichum godetiae]|uniref:Uncharacterized protein n=1 Tax=Colletotrichum godetiae TaxID=1209918 RepID=A0AAJ0ENV8_9PEZI|nr:uncharacterized protein BDP55DRAFT_719243 [Colletotrichum godetiae]KAK1671001.1 hypothetical protein BDP55DRAFT_719243 [Colletotrichum godetiae]
MAESIEKPENPVILPLIEFSPVAKVESSPAIDPLPSSPMNPPTEASSVTGHSPQASPAHDPPIHISPPVNPPDQAFAPLDEAAFVIDAVYQAPPANSPRPVIEARTPHPSVVLPPLPAGPASHSTEPPSQSRLSIPQISYPSLISNRPPTNPNLSQYYRFQSPMGICQGMETEILSNALGSMTGRGDEAKFKTPVEYAVILQMKTKMTTSLCQAVAERTRVEDDFRKVSGQPHGGLVGMSGAVTDMGLNALIAKMDAWLEEYHSDYGAAPGGLGSVPGPAPPGPSAPAA